MKQLVAISILLLGWLTVQSQSLEELRQRRLQTADEIRLTNELLTRVSSSQQTTLNRLRVLNSQIGQRNNMISTMNDEISLLQEVINNNLLAVSMLSEDLDALKEEYAHIIRFANRSRGNADQWLFFLSAESFQQAYRRFLYLKQYTQYRQMQAQLIASLQSLMRKKATDLEKQQAARREVLGAQLEETRKLELEKRQQNNLSQQLQSQQRDLRNKLAQQRRIEQQLEQEIQKIIEEEARKTGTSAREGFALTPEQRLIGNNFEQNRRRLPWPVERGIITEKFGVHPHPVLRNVTVNSNGVSIATEAGAQARAVFNGEVSRVFGISGGNTAVIIRHGQYLTVYSNLVDVRVKMGDQVSVRQQIGKVFSDPADGNKAILKFQIWRESTKLDPEEWLTR